MADARSRPEGGRAVALTQDLSEFLIELSIALHRHGMYPQGHPSLLPAELNVVARLTPLIAERGSLSLGVARRQLIIEGSATDPKHPVLQELAGRLHRHHIGAVRFEAGTEVNDRLVPRGETLGFAGGAVAGGVLAFAPMGAAVPVRAERHSAAIPQEA